MLTRIQNGLVVDKGRMRAEDLLVEGEQIVGLCPRGEGPEGDVVVDASGRLVLPGFIDAHNHPVYADRLGTLSKAALAAGITTVIPYMGAVAAWGQTLGLHEAIEAFIAEGEAESWVDFGVHCTLTRNALEEADAALPRLFARGVVSFKGFTSYRQRGMKLEDEEILHIMEIVASLGGLLAFHAENGALLDYLEGKAQAEGRTHPRHYPGTHPNLSEAEAIFRVLTLAAHTGCGIYLPHVTCAESLAVIELFRSWNRVHPLYVETCPHYLTLDDSALDRFGNLAKMSPPLRRIRDQEALWTALAEGRIDVVASDAAGHSRAANEPQFDQTFKAPHGTPGVESLPGVFWDAAVNTGRLKPEQVVELLCANPARIFGLYPRKGSLEPGADADIVLFDPGAEWIIPDQNPHLAVDYSLFAGRVCKGRPDKVFLRGHLVADGEKLVESRPRGGFVPGKLG